jgi:hypothetical protein
VTRETQGEKFESAQEELARRIKELYALADKMGLRLTISMKTKPVVAPPQKPREPGEN